MLKNKFIIFVICYLLFGIYAQSALVFAQGNTFYNQGPAQDESAFFEEPSQGNTYYNQGARGPHRGNVFYNQGGRGGSVGITNPLASVADDIPGLIGYILYLARFFAGAIAVLMIIVGAYQILFGGANPKSWEQGKKTILYAVIGFAIVLLAEVVVDIIRELVG